MILISKEEFIKLKGKDIINVVCDQCKCVFERSKRNIMDNKRSTLTKDVSNWEWNKNLAEFCSTQCLSDYRRRDSKMQKCVECDREVYTRRCASWQSKNKFCSHSCSATYNNKHKTHGTRRSKLEAWLEENLKRIYPDLELHCNRKDAINSELDFYFPTLRLAVELNGIFHYEPIYGSDTLERIQNNDNRKFQACIENGIELCIIDASAQRNFTAKSSQKYLDIITTIINSKI